MLLLYSPLIFLHPYTFIILNKCYSFNKILFLQILILKIKYSKIYAEIVEGLI